MEKICEFCAVLKPVVYCIPDAAFLCLSCDAKVHSANTLSSRHVRTLLCDSCRNRPAFARCLEHRMFVCSSCDKSIHKGSSPHQKRALSSYTGCPSAKDFAALWGFALDGCVGSSSRQQNVGSILQQILDLKKLQLTATSSLEQMSFSSSVCQDADNADCMLKDSLSQSENLLGPTASANPLVGESFWQCKSPVRSGQLWSQNMQDLGVCEDVLFNDDFNIPDVDITFRNFEELFATEQNPNRALLDEKDASLSFSSQGKDMSLDTCQNRNSEKRVDTSAAYKDMDPMNQGFDFSGSPDNDQTIRPSMSFSMSRFSADSIGLECFDSELSPFISEAELSCHSADLERLLSGPEEVTMTRKEKQTRYAPRKAGSDVRKRLKGRVGKREDDDSDSIDVTRSY